MLMPIFDAVRDTQDKCAFCNRKSRDFNAVSIRKYNKITRSELLTIDLDAEFQHHKKRNLIGINHIRISKGQSRIVCSPGMTLPEGFQILLEYFLRSPYLHLDYIPLS